MGKNTVSSSHSPSPWAEERPQPPVPDTAAPALSVPASPASTGKIPIQLLPLPGSCQDSRAHSHPVGPHWHPPTQGCLSLPSQAKHGEGSPANPSRWARLTFGGTGVSWGVEVLLTGVEAASWGRAGTCGHRASVPGPGHRHLMNTLQEQGLIVPMAQGGTLLETPSAPPLLLGMLGKLVLSSFVRSKSTRGCLGTATRTGLLQGTGSLRAPDYPKPLTVLQQPAWHKEPW